MSTLETFKKHILEALHMEMNWGNKVWSEHTHAQKTVDCGKDETDILFIEQNQTLTLQMMERNYNRVQGLRSALSRVHRGTFGICQECECAIPQDRLMANLGTTNCVVCQDELEMRTA